MNNIFTKRGMNAIVVVLGILILTVGCSKEEKLQTPKEEDKIQFLKSALGGCNGNRAYVAKEEEEDTVIFTFLNDTLNIFTGLNYICCAPFVTDCNVINDSIFISIADTCTNLYHTCYCRCYCYYTFDYYFEITGNKNYHCQVLLNNPAEENPILFYSGEIDEAILEN